MWRWKEFLRERSRISIAFHCYVRLSKCNDHSGHALDICKSTTIQHLWFDNVHGSLSLSLSPGFSWCWWNFVVFCCFNHFLSHGRKGTLSRNESYSSIYIRFCLVVFVFCFVSEVFSMTSWSRHQYDSISPQSMYTLLIDPWMQAFLCEMSNLFLSHQNFMRSHHETTNSSP